MRGETGDRPDQEAPAPSRSYRDRHEHRHPRDRPPARRPGRLLAFYRDALGFEVRNEVGYGGMRWITVGPADQPGMSISGFPFVFKLDKTHRVDVTYDSRR